MKARLVPVYFPKSKNEAFDTQLENLKKLLAGHAEFLPPEALGPKLPGKLTKADAVVFPQLVGDAYKQVEELKQIKVPLLALTSDFGTVNMWDWEIVSFLKSEGCRAVSPYTLDLTKKICRTLALKREMKETRFLLFQDHPGEGMQGDIFKRFYWWEERCTDLIKRKFGITLERKSFKALERVVSNIFRFFMPPTGLARTSRRDVRRFTPRLPLFQYLYCLAVPSSSTLPTPTSNPLHTVTSPPLPSPSPSVHM